MSQHTPGPWKYGIHADNTHCVFSKGGDVIAVCDENEAEFWGSEGYTNEANARLIAAAPETAAERDKLRDDKAVLTGMLQQSRATVWGLKARNAELVEIAKENLENHAWKQKTKGFQLPCGCNACVRIRALMAKIEGGK